MFTNLYVIVNVYYVYRNNSLSLNDNLLLTIANNCKQLSSLMLNTDDYSEEAIKQFGEICGKQLKCITFTDLNYSAYFKRQQLLKLCPNLIQIRCLMFADIVCKNNLL